MNLIATATEFRQDVRRQHFRVAAGYVDIDIILLQKTVQHIVKGNTIARQGWVFNIPAVLDFINQHIVFASALDFLPKEFPQNYGIAQFCLFIVIQGNLDYLGSLHLVRQQIITSFHFFSSKRLFMEYTLFQGNRASHSALQGKCQPLGQIP